MIFIAWIAFIPLEQKFLYSLLGKGFEKQTKTIEEHGKKQAETLDFLKPEENKKYINSVEDLIPKDKVKIKIKIK